jgi:hypothetical protein
MKKGSMQYDQYGRKRKVGHLYKSTKAKPNFDVQMKKKFREVSDIPSAPVGEYTVPKDNSYKGAYQVIPKGEVKDIGK